MPSVSHTRVLLFYFLIFLSGVEVPVVSVVLEGGENTMNTAKSAMESGTPVVIVNGSGRAADFIARAFKETEDKKSE